MTRWETFNAVCGHLRAGLLGGPEFEWDSQTPWELLVEFSGRHNVTPALAWCLAVKPGIADDVRAFLRAVLERNGQRNARLLDCLARVVGALNALDIEPVLLKGAAHLVEGIYPTAELRVVGDLDLLVPRERGDDAAAALANIQFVATTNLVPANHAHLPTMYDETGIDVEIHTRVEHGTARNIVPVAWFREATRPCPFRDLKVRIPDATRSIAHNIVHSQIDHGRFNQIELRALLDLATIRARHESTIDWADVDRRFTVAGFGDLLATYLSLAEILFGQPAPKLSGHPQARFFEAFRSAVERPRKKRPRRRTAPILHLEQVEARRVDRFAGFLDQVASNREITTIRGWAVDFGAKEAARSVRIFVNGQPVLKTIPATERPDVAAAFDVPGIDECGFFVSLRTATGPHDAVQIFAELRGGVFAELHPAAGVSVLSTDQAACEPSDTTP